MYLDLYACMHTGWKSCQQRWEVVAALSVGGHHGVLETNGIVGVSDQGEGFVFVMLLFVPENTCVGLQKKSCCCFLSPVAH